MSRMKTLWHIQGFDGVTKIYECRVAFSRLSQKQVQQLLMTLAAKAGLTLDEIVEAHTTKRENIGSETRNLLHVRRDGPYLRFSCGDGPVFTAVAVEEADIQKSRA